MKALLKLVYGIKVNLAIQEQQLITLYQVRQRKQLRLERFAKRPYRVEGDLELERPIVTVGDVPNRAELVVMVVLTWTFSLIIYLNLIKEKNLLNSLINMGGVWQLQQL